MNLSSIGKRIFGARKVKNNKETPESITKSLAGGKTRAGKQVTWELTVRAMYTDVNPREILVRTSYADYYENVWVTLSLSDYPQILNCSSGSRINVQGRIQSIQGEDIYLEDCRFEFLD